MINRTPHWFDLALIGVVFNSAQGPSTSTDHSDLDVAPAGPVELIARANGFALRTSTQQGPLRRGAQSKAPTTVRLTRT
jgi:hypothetical protein